MNQNNDQQPKPNPEPETVTLEIHNSVLSSSSELQSSPIPLTANEAPAAPAKPTKD